MTDLVKGLKLDKWYTVTLVLGAMCCACPFFKTVDFISAKHMFGLGIGLILISMSNLIALCYIQQPIYGGFLQWQEIIHTPLTRIMLVLGFILTMLFLILVVSRLL